MLRAPLGGTPSRWAYTGAVAFLPALVAYLLVAGLQRHRHDLDLALTAPTVVIVGLAGWITLRAVVSITDRPARPSHPSARLAPRRLAGSRFAPTHRPEFGNLARLAVPLVGAVYLLVAVGVLVRLRLAGLPGSPRYPLAGLTVSLAIGSAGLIALTILVRSQPARRVVRFTEDGRGTPGPAGIAIIAVTLVGVVLAGLSRNDDNTFALGTEQIRPASLVALLTLATFAIVVELWTRPPIDDDQNQASVYLVLLLVAVGAGLVLAIGPDRPSPSIAAAVGLIWLVAARTKDRWAPALGLAATLATYVLVAALSHTWHRNPYTPTHAHVTAHAPDDAYAALALARASTFGRGPGQGLAESYAPHGTVPDRYALNVIAEELGLLGLFLILAITILVGALLVRLAARCGHGLLGAWARGLTAATLITLTLPVLALLCPTLNIDASPPALAPDSLGLIALLWTIGALLGAASRTTHTATPAQRTPRPTATSTLDRLRERTTGRTWEPAVAGLCVIATLVAVPLAATTADHQRSTTDPGNTSAAAAANTIRTAKISVRWPQSPGLLDSTTRQAVDNVVTPTRQCPAQTADRPTDGTFTFRTTCSPARLVPTLDVALQTAANKAIQALPTGVRGATIAIDTSDGRLLVLTDGTGTAPLPTVPEPPPGTHDKPTSEVRTNPKGPADPLISAVSVGADDAGGEAAGTDGGAEAVRWSTPVPTGDRLIGDLLNASPALTQALLADLRVDALTKNPDGIMHLLNIQKGLFDRAVAQPLSNAKDVAPTLSAADTAIRDAFKGCITFDNLDKIDTPKEHTLHFAQGTGCAVRLANVILARGAANSPQPGAVRTLIDRWLLTGPAGSALSGEGLTAPVIQASGLQTLNNPACGKDPGCLRISPLQFATVLAGLVTHTRSIDLAKLDDSPAPFLLSARHGSATQAAHDAKPWQQPRPASSATDTPRPAAASSAAGPSKLPALWNDDTDSLNGAVTGGASWSVRVMPKGDRHGKIVIVSYRTSNGTAQPDEKPASTLTDPVAAAVTKGEPG
ncbi:FtsW/RodA/SpoVE family cell cycle protein [Frankia sp. AgPm24]|uniref:FtsW/RodA/SpoVE family cell cycle protein n=1 Tax=Frankia sp. AgPm24 TaxID=631128 RepID=UPI002551FD8E|nr:FtsW/RodA/SpoVE family cell cycle protein [Frankia sp. AgPm24]